MHCLQNARLVGQAHADDEGKSELFAIGGIEPVKGLELFRRHPVEPGRGLLSGGGIGQRLIDGGLTGQFRVSTKQVQTLAF